MNRRSASATDTESGGTRAIPANWQFDWMAPLYDGMVWHRDWDRLDRALEAEGCRRILDLGGGTAMLAEHLGSPDGGGPHVVTTDLNRAMLRVGVRKRRPGSLVAGDALALPFRDRCFDRVFMGDAFHHMPRHPRVLREVRRVLTPAGQLLVEEFDPDRWAGWFLYGVERVMGMGSRFVTPDHLRGLVREAGFEQSGFWRDGFVYYLRARPA